jgi:hypothetical protein
MTQLLAGIPGRGAWRLEGSTASVRSAAVKVGPSGCPAGTADAALLTAAPLPLCSDEVRLAPDWASSPKPLLPQKEVSTADDVNRSIPTDKWHSRGTTPHGVNRPSPQTQTNSDRYTNYHFNTTQMVRAPQAQFTPMRRGRLPYISCRHARVDGLERSSGRNASPSGITPSNILSPAPSQPVGRGPK